MVRIIAGNRERDIMVAVLPMAAIEIILEIPFIIIIVV